MRYHNITKDDMLNGDGLRVVLWVAGCNHNCKGCHNPVTWDIRGGIPFDQAAKEELFEELKKPYVSGVTLSGGDPLHPDNRRDIGELITDLFLERQLDEVYVIFTRMVTSFQMEPTIHKLLPLDPDTFPKYEKDRDAYDRSVVYIPSVKAVMDRLVPGYVRGDLYGALVESYCSEQNARMTAMKASSDNARKMLQELDLSYNRARQAAITQEITEVVGGAQAAL